LSVQEVDCYLRILFGLEFSLKRSSQINVRHSSVRHKFQWLAKSVEAIDAYLAEHNLRAKRYVWKSQRGRSTPEDQRSLGISDRLITKLG
jgi:phage-related protein